MMINYLLNFIKSPVEKIRSLDWGNIILYILPENWMDHKKTYILFWSIFSFSIIFFIWAAFAEINQVVRAQGEVIPDSKVHLVQSSIVGPVEEIKVQLGDQVELNQILFLVDYKQSKKYYDIQKQEVEARNNKVKIISKFIISYDLDMVVVL